MTTNTTNTVTLPKTRSRKSAAVLVSMWLFAFAVGGGLVAIFTPAVAPLAVIIGLVAIGVCVLSLREDL